MIKQYRKRRYDLVDFLCDCCAGAVCAAILFLFAMLCVDAWVKEDVIRVEKLKQHQYEITMQSGSHFSGNFSPPAFVPERKTHTVVK